MAMRLDKQRGVSLIEYILIASLIAVAAVVIMGSLGSQIKTKFVTICSTIVGSSTGCSS